MQSEPFVARVKEWIREQRLLIGGETVLVGVSGGPDSVALLRVLQALERPLRLRLVAAHVHHGLRGAAADRDQQCVESLAAQCGYACVARRLTPSAGDNETALRAARYDALVTLAQAAQASHIAVGHTLDDQAETVAMRIIRGTGFDGLQGIPPARALGPCRLIRPLRNVWRSDVETWLQAMGQPWCEDATNANPTWLRNRVRHELLPRLAAEYNPQMKRALCQLAEAAAAAGQYMDAHAAQWLALHAAPTSDGVTIPRRAFFEQPKALQQAILRRALRQVQGHLRRFTYQHWLAVDALLGQRPCGAVVDLPLRMQVALDGDALVLRRRLQERDTMPVAQHLHLRV